MIFHLALIAGLIPGVSGLVALLVGPRLRASEPRWARRVSALAILDSIILVGLASLALSTAATRAAPATTSDVGRPRIGVELDYSASSGALVSGVRAGSPAALADIRAGDSIVRVDDVAIPDAATLVRTIDSGVAGTARRLEVVRDGATRSIDVTPRLWTAASTEPTRCEEGLLGGARWRELIASPATWSLLASSVVVLVALFAWGRRRGLSARESASVLLPLVAVLLLGSLPGQLVAVLACPSLVARGARVETIGLLFGGAALTASALVLLRANRRLAPSLADDGPRYGLGRTLVQSIAYLLVWMPRASTLAIPIAVWVGSDLGEARVASVLRGAGRSPLDAALTLVAVAVIAPIGEEALFRGVLAPHLARLTSALTAVLVTAAVFGALHIGGHGALFVGPLFLGAIFGWARLRSGGMAAPIALHVLVNATSVGASLALGR